MKIKLLHAHTHTHTHTHTDLCDVKRDARADAHCAPKVFCIWGARCDDNVGAEAQHLDRLWQLLVEHVQRRCGCQLRRGRVARVARERERDRERQRERERDRETETETERDRDRETETETGRQTDRQTDRDRDREGGGVHCARAHEYVCGMSACARVCKPTNRFDTRRSSSLSHHPRPPPLPGPLNCTCTAAQRTSSGYPSAKATCAPGRIIHRLCVCASRRTKSGKGKNSSNR